MKRKILLRIGLCLLWGVVLTGCGIQKRPPLQKQTFLLEVRHREASAGQSLAACLHIRHCRAASAFAGNQLVYRTGQVTYEQDYYNTFLVSPEDQIDEFLNQWFISSGLFACLPNAETLTLEPHLDILYTDFQEKTSPEAVVQFHIRVTRFDQSCSCPVVLLNKTYTANTPLSAKPAAGDIVNGLNAALTQILQELETDLVQSGKGLPL
jgi:uncharacterized lipoprotein YmbA